jgi:hypothetical protein
VKRTSAKGRQRLKIREQEAQGLLQLAIDLGARDHGVGAAGAVSAERQSPAATRRVVMSGRLDLLLAIWLLFAVAVFGCVVVGLVASRFI